MISGRPHVWHVHEHIGDEPRPYRLLIRLILLVFPGLIVANSRSVAQALIGGGGRLLARTRVVENSVNPESVPTCQPARGRTGRPVIGVVGRLAPRKGTAEALHAAALLARRGETFEMRFIGGPPPGQEELARDYHELAARLGVERYVVFAGEVDSVASEYAAFDVLLLPSQRPEPFGLVVIEGMAAGLPVVATLNGGGSDEILRHGRTGFYCGKTPEAMANLLARVLHDDEERHRVGRAAAEAARQRYSSESYRAAIARVYDRLAPSNR
jgi:glycosyltransferase involved in cell wall biosynthesis